MIIHPYEKHSLIYKEKEVVKKTSKKKEIDDSIYQLLKNEYQKVHFSKWDDKMNKDIEIFFQNMIDTFKENILSLTNRKKQEFIISSFRIIIGNKPSFFKDSNLSTYNRFWNKVIQQDKIKSSIDKLLDSYLERVSRF